MRLDFGISQSMSRWRITDDLSLHYTSRSGVDLFETQSGLNLNAKILPSCGQITTSNYAALDIAAFEGSDQSGYIESRFYFNGTNSLIYLFCVGNNGNTAGYFTVHIINKKVVLTYRNGVTPPANTLTSVDSLSAGWNTIRWTCNGTSTTLLINGNYASFTGTDNGVWLADVQSPNTMDNISIGAMVLSSITYSAETFKIDYVDYSNKHKWIITGMGTRIFDIIGTNHLTWIGTNHLAYDAGASTYMLDNGYSIWTKSGNANEYVPYKNGSPMDSSLGIIGYEKRASYNGGSTIYNYAPSLVDFDYLGTANSRLAIFDKSNTIIHIESGSMSYFDASNTYRWRQDELEDIRIYSELYKKVGYRGRMMIKGTVTSGLVKDFKECVVFSSDKTGNKQWNTAKYCTIQDIVIQDSGIPVLDENNYLTYNALPADLVALSICFIGDSTMGSHASGLAQSRIFNLYTQFSTYNIATTGDTINQQKTKWNSIPSNEKLLFDYVLVQIGLNDLADTTPNFILNYQALIDQIKIDTKPSCKIVASTMSPCFGYYTNPLVRQKYLDANAAIAGGGGNPITGIDYVNALNTSLLADPINYLAAIYDYGDHLHPNSAGRLVIYNNYLPYIVR